MVELRKRKTPPPAPAPSAKKAKPGPKPGAGATGKLARAKAAITKTLKGATGKKASKDEDAVANGEAKAAAAGPPAVGDVIALEGFGDEVETHEGTKVTLKSLAEESKAGVVLFTYPKASTPGCTTQACLFRDSYAPLTATGLAIYGLSNDSPKANTTFKTKQNLPYPLLCNPSGSLIKAIGLGKAGGKTQRGVFVVDKAGKVLAAEPGGPAATVEVVRKLVDSLGGGAAAEPAAFPADAAATAVPNATTDAAKAEATATDLAAQKSEDKEKADVAGEVADTAAKLDG